MTYHDPRDSHPLFPHRPKHPDFIALSEVVQWLDQQAEAGTDLVELAGLDGDSMAYMIHERANIFCQVMPGLRAIPLATLMGVMTDSLVIGYRTAILKQGQPS